ncbi:rod shape-determining protein RodA [Pelagibacteraceae bacterium]|nr:rod shape-determining protein RodA [Pelagibacteraceae bacterium]
MPSLNQNIFQIFFTKIKSLDWIVLSLIILISLVSLLTLSSLDFDNKNILQKHSYRIIFSFFIFFVAATINIKVWYKTSYFFYGLVILLLIFVDSFGLVGKGAKRWLDIGLFNLQPSELMKVAVILALARYYQYIKTDEIDRIKNLVLPITLIILPFILVIKQPDLGTAIFILLVAISILWLAGLRLKIFIFGTISLLILAPLSVAFLKPYQKERILTFLNPENDPTGAGYHVIQSKIAIGSGGFFGQGYMEGSQSNLSFLPEPHTDFIFTAFAEQFGFFGSVLLLLLFLFLIFRIDHISKLSRSTFGRLLCFGISFNFFVYIAVNIGMVTGLLPVVGVPIPIMSYGGTAMITSMFSLGLVTSAKIHKDENLY